MSRKSGKGRRVSLGAVLSQMLPVVLCFGLLGAVGILHVASRSQVVDAAYRLSALEAESRTLALANDRLLPLVELSADDQERRQLAGVR